MKNIMCSPVVHAQSSVEKHSGVIEDYTDIYLFMKESKLYLREKYSDKMPTTEEIITLYCKHVLNKNILDITEEKKQSLLELSETNPELAKTAILILRDLAIENDDKRGIPKDT